MYCKMTYQIIGEEKKKKLSYYIYKTIFIYIRHAYPFVKFIHSIIIHILSYVNLFSMS